MTIATGSEVALAVAAQQVLAEKGVGVFVVSMPSCFAFDRQDKAYRDSVLARGVPRAAAEAGVTGFWWKCVGLDGTVVGIDRLGESNPANQLFEYSRLTAAGAGDAVEGVLAR